MRLILVSEESCFSHLHYTGGRRDLCYAVFALIEEQLSVGTNVLVSQEGPL